MLNELKLCSFEHSSAVVHCRRLKCGIRFSAKVRKNINVIDKRRPRSNITTQYILQVQELKNDSRRITVREISAVSFVSVVTIIKKELKLDRISPGGWMQCFLLHNSRHYTATATQTQVEERHWSALDHPSYNRYLSSCGFHFFGPSKDLGRKQFSVTKRCKNSCAIGYEQVQKMFPKKE